MKEKAATKLQQLGFGYTQSQIMPERYNNRPHPPTAKLVRGLALFSTSASKKPDPSRGAYAANRPWQTINTLRTYQQIRLYCDPISAWWSCYWLRCCCLLAIVLGLIFRAHCSWLMRCVRSISISLENPPNGFLGVLARKI